MEIEGETRTRGLEMEHALQIEEEPKGRVSGGSSSKKRRRRIRRIFSEALEIVVALALALMVWKSFVYLSGTSTPAVVVLSGSMEPGIRRGDVLLLRTMVGVPVRAGEIVVFKLVGRDIPIVHRVIKVHGQRMAGGDVEILTKGDRNPNDDLFLYGPDQQWIQRKDLLGRVVWFVPFLGQITLLLTENKHIKYILPLAICLLIMLATFRRR